MISKVASNRFIVSSLKGFYRCLTYQNFHTLGKRLVYEAETAQAFRQIEELEELGLILSNFPLKEYRLVGQYYIGWCVDRKGHDARKLFEKVVEGSDVYRSLALIELASGEARKGDLSSAIAYFTEAVKYSQIPYTVVLAERSIAAFKGIDGHHNKALKALERIAPLVRYSQPVERYQYLNSLAVELTEVGRIEEAANISRIVLASPFAFAYPEWRETGREIALRGYKSRSIVSVIQPVRENVLKLPLAESSSNSTQEESAKVFSLLEWKDKMVKEPNGDDKDKIDLENATEKDLYLRLMELVAKRDLTTWQLSQVIDFVEKLSSKPDPGSKKD